MVARPRSASQRQPVSPRSAAPPPVVAALSPRRAVNKDEKDEGVVIPTEKKSVKELATEHMLAAEEAGAVISPRKVESPHEVALPLSPVVKTVGVLAAPSTKGRGRGVGRGSVAKPPPPQQ